MPWCPKCHTEYSEGFDTCADCHIPLLETPPKDLSPRDLGGPVLLQTLNTIEAEMLIEVLKEQQIPVFKKGLGEGGYTIAYGITYFDVQIYVPQQLLQQAREIAEALYPPEGWENVSQENSDLSVITEDGEDD